MECRVPLFVTGSILWDGMSGLSRSWDEGTLTCSKDLRLDDSVEEEFLISVTVGPGFVVDTRW